MTWTKDLPTKSDYWWYRSRNVLAQPVRVYVYGTDRVDVCFIGMNGTSDAKRLRGEWSTEPIAKPEVNHNE